MSDNTPTPTPEPNPPLVSQVVSALATALMDRTLAKGKEIEIPKLGIRIEPPAVAADSPPIITVSPVSSAIAVLMLEESLAKGNIIRIEPPASADSQTQA